MAIALALAGQPPLIEASLPDVWPTETDTHRRCPVFHLPALHGPGWAQCTEGLAHPARENGPLSSTNRSPMVAMTLCWRI
ncbi:hypothetical protein KFU94_12420 [Chloroflexi bacterium TSY]|nr:hypothetical protein [Chloroflexi bacterium TSY]